MKQMELQLNNGYKVVISIGINDDYPNEIRIDTYDSDDTWNQELVRVSNYIENDEGTGHNYDEEKFCIDVSTDDEIGMHEFIVGLHHDEEVENESEEKIVDNEDENEEQSSTFKSLKFGAKGEEVKKIQRRLKELNYFDGTIGGNYLTKTQTAVKDFQKDNGLQIDGECDEVTYNRLFSSEAKKKEVKVVDDSIVEPAHGTAKVMDWWKSDIQKIFSKGTIATFTDVDTGKAWRVRAKNGTNHRDWEPLTAQDTAIFKSIVKKWSWERRAIFVTINGVNYAASINCMPHSSSSISNNNYPGHSCCHFKNSRTHCSNKVCPKHQAAINKAAKAVLE